MKNTIIIIALAALLSTTSCEKEIVLDVNPSEPRYVIEAMIEAGSAARVRVTRSKNYNEDNLYPSVEDALITITSDNGESEILILMPSGVYESATVAGTEGVTYRLSIEIDDHLYTSEAKIPDRVPIANLDMFTIPVLNAAFPRVTLDDPQGIDNYYRIRLFINDKLMPDIHISDDKDTDGVPNIIILPYDPKYNSDKEIQKGDKIGVEMLCTDSGSYTYFETLRRLGSSLTNPISNISGGALGYFCAYTSEKREIIADW